MVASISKYPSPRSLDAETSCVRRSFGSGALAKDLRSRALAGDLEKVLVLHPEHRKGMV